MLTMGKRDIASFIHSESSLTASGDSAGTSQVSTRLIAKRVCVTIEHHHRSASR